MKSAKWLKVYFPWVDVMTTAVTDARHGCTVTECIRISYDLLQKFLEDGLAFYCAMCTLDNHKWYAISFAYLQTWEWSNYKLTKPKHLQLTYPFLKCRSLEFSIVRNWKVMPTLSTLSNLLVARYWGQPQFNRLPSWCNQNWYNWCIIKSTEDAARTWFHKLFL